MGKGETSVQIRKKLLWKAGDDHNPAMSPSEQSTGHSNKEIRNRELLNELNHAVVIKELQQKKKEFPKLSALQRTVHNKAGITGTPENTHLIS